MITEYQISRATRFVHLRNRPYRSAIQQYMKLPNGAAFELFEELKKRGVV